MSERRGYSPLEQSLFDKVKEKKVIYLESLSPQELGAMGRLKMNGDISILKDRDTKKKYIEYVTEVIVKVEEKEEVKEEVKDEQENKPT